MSSICSHCPSCPSLNLNCRHHRLQEPPESSLILVRLGSWERGIKEGAELEGTLGYSTASIDDRSARGSLAHLGVWAEDVEEDREGRYRTQYLRITGWLESLQGEYLEVMGYI